MEIELLILKKKEFYSSLNENLIQKETDTFFLINDDKMQNVKLDFKYDKSKNLYNYISQKIKKDICPIES